MGRKKVNLQWIANDTSRRAVFNKRSEMLKKKTSELVTLCGVKACVVIYDENGEHPEVWPSVAEAREMLTSYKEMPNVPQWKTEKSQEEYLQKCINNLQKQATRFEEENKDRAAQILFHEAVAGCRPGLVGVTSDELTRLSKLVEDKKKKVLERMQQLGIVPPEQPQPQQQLQQHPPTQQASVFNDMHRQASVQEPQQQNMLLVPSPATNLGYGAFVGNSSGAGPSTGNTSLGLYGAFAGNSSGAGPSTGNTSLGYYNAIAGNSSTAGPITANTSLGYNGAFAGNSGGAGLSNANISLDGLDMARPPFNQGVWPPNME